MGWFSGYAEDLMPLPRQERASAYIDIIGVEKLLNAAQRAMGIGEAKYKVNHCSSF